MGGKSLVPRNSGEGGIGKSDTWWGTGYFNNIYCDTGYFGDQLLLSGRDVMEIIDTTVEQKIEEVGGGPRWERAETEGNIYFPNNVGINNSNPSEKLDVSGNVLVSNNLTVTNLLSGRSIFTQDLFISGSGFNTVAKELSLEVLQPGSNVFLDKDPIRRTLKIHTLHEPIQSSESSINEGRTYIQSIELDQHGHVIDLISGTETGIDTQRTDDEIKDIGTGLIKEGINVTIDKNTTDKTLIINSHHPVIPRAQENSDNSDRDYIQNIKFDEYGHVTGLEMGTETITSSQVLSNVQAGDNVRILENDNDGIDIFSDHPATENVAGSTFHTSDSRIYIQDIKLDEFGHITGIESNIETITVSDLSDYVSNNIVAGDNIEIERNKTYFQGGGVLDQFSEGGAYLSFNSNWTSPIEGIYADTGTSEEFDFNLFLQESEFEQSGISVDYLNGEISLDPTSPLIINGSYPYLSGTWEYYNEGSRFAISSSHIPIDDASSSVNNEDRNYVQSLKLDQYGHVTGISSAAENFVPRTDSEILGIAYDVLLAGENISLVKDDLNKTVTINSSHIAVEAEESVTNSLRTYIQSIQLDDHGHVTEISSAAENFIPRTDTDIYNVVSNVLSAGDNITLSKNASNEEVTISSNHITTHPASSTANSNRAYIQNISFDSYGHVLSTTSSNERTDLEIINVIGDSLVEGQNVSIDKSTEGEIKISYDSASTILATTYPIGSIYISVNSDNPASVFGGTWESFAKGRCLIGLDSNDPDFNLVEKPGGEKDVTLSVNELPSHNHGKTPLYVGENSHRGGSGSAFSIDNVVEVEAGGDNPHNNMQPYIVVYMWKRTA
jgi:hypothetical protein